jgi:hypothetical protein
MNMRLKKYFDIAWLVDLVHVNGLSKQNISLYTFLTFPYVYFTIMVI